MVDELHIYVFACVVLQTTEETGRCDRSDGARSEKRIQTRKRRWTDEVTQAGTVAMLEPGRVLASRGADDRSRVERVPHTFIAAVGGRVV